MTQAVIVTGGGRGIGRSLCMQLAKKYAVLVIGRTESDLQDVCAAIRKDGGQAEYLVGDVQQQEVAQAAIAKVSCHDWQLHAVICNAGIGKSGSTHELSDKQWRETFGVNVDGSFYLSQAALPVFMKQKSGVICFINSLAGLKGYAYEAAYVATKHAIVGLTKTLALEYGKHGITSIAICPGFVESDMTNRTIKSLASRRGIDESEARAVIEKVNPQRRIIPQQEIAEMVDFVCSNLVPSLSGSCLTLSGGL